MKVDFGSHIDPAQHRVDTFSNLVWGSLRELIGHDLFRSLTVRLRDRGTPKQMLNGDLRLRRVRIYVEGTRT